MAGLVLSLTCRALPNRSDRAERRRSPPRPARSPQGHARIHLGQGRPGHLVQRAHQGPRTNRVRTGLQARARRHREQAKRFTLPLRPIARLAQDEAPGARGGEAGGRRRLGRLTILFATDPRYRKIMSGAIAAGNVGKVTIHLERQRPPGFDQAGGVWLRKRRP
jgi:hypothetical protein